MEPNINGAAVQPSEAKRSGRNSKPTKALIVLCVLLILLAAAYAGLCAHASGGSRIFPGTTITGLTGGDVDLGGLRLDAAVEKLGAEARQADDTQMQVQLVLPDSGEPIPEAGEPVQLTFGQLGGVEVDAQATAEMAVDYCREASFLQSGWRYLRGMMGRSELAPILTAPALNEKTPVLVPLCSLEPVDTAYTLEADSLTITAPRDGYTVAPDDLTDTITDALHENALEFSCTGTVLDAQVLTAQQIHDNLAGGMRNAGYDAKTGTIIPEKDGADFDLNEAQEKLDSTAPGETFTMKAVITRPKVTAEILRPVLFRDVLGSCTTPVRGSSARKSNVRLAASSFNGVVLNSGETFSYNGTVGKRTTAKGYQAAPAYVKGETVDEIGGGVCQPSSTLYLATMRANLKITERYAHRYAPSYIPAGMDATVSWGGPDFKFTNNTDYPVKILTSYSGGKLTVTLRGTNVTGYHAEITNEKLETIPYKEVIKEDPTLPAGTQQVKTTPYTGYKYRTYRSVYSSSGALISRKVEASSNYKSRDRVILKGTGTHVAPPVDPNTPVTPPVDPNVPVTPPVDPNVPVTPPVDPNVPVTPPTEPEAPVTPPAPETPAP